VNLPSRVVVPFPCEDRLQVQGGNPRTARRLRVHGLVRSSVGDGEVVAFISNVGIQQPSDPNEPNENVCLELERRILRLDQLVRRVDTIPLQPSFHPNCEAQANVKGVSEREAGENL
jgi:hypothetical protein